MDDFSMHLPEIMPHLLSSLNDNQVKKRARKRGKREKESLTIGRVSSGLTGRLCSHSSDPSRAGRLGASPDGASTRQHLRKDGLRFSSQFCLVCCNVFWTRISVYRKQRAPRLPHSKKRQLWNLYLIWNRS